jgi:hypothetical protein
LSELLLDEQGRIVEPAVVVNLNAELAPPASDRLLIGIATRPLDPGRRALASELDVTLAAEAGREFVTVDEPESCAAALCAAAAANPQAVLVLKQVLRVAPSSVASALDVESFAYSALLGGTEFAAWLAARGPRPLPPPASSDPVLVDRVGDVLQITLNRPERRNAYGREVRDGLVEALNLALVDSSIEKVVLTGAGLSFSAGGDLDEFGTAPDPATGHFVRTRAGAGLLLHRLADRTEARLHGSCVGAGIELPAFAGRVVAHPDTTFRLPEAAMGLIPGAGGTVSIPGRIGRWRALYLVLSGRALDASTALSWGLVDALEP